MIGKKGAISHVEIILSFVIFISFLLFLLAVFPVTGASESKVGLDSAQRGIINFASVNLTSFTIALNPEPDNCFYFSSTTEVNDVIVKKEDEVRVQAFHSGNVVYVNNGGKFYTIYSLEPSLFEESSPFDFNTCDNLILNPGNIKFGLIKKEKILSYDLLDNLNSSYYNDEGYENLHSQFSMPKKENFGFIVFESSGGIIMQAIKNRPERTSIMARNVPAKIIYNNGTIIYVIINVQTW